MTMSGKSKSNRGRRGRDVSRWVHFGILPALLLAMAPGSRSDAASALAAPTPASSPAASSASPAAGAAPAGWLDSAQRDLAQREYELSWQASPGVDDVEASWHAPNRSQGFRTYFTSEGIRVVPRTESTLAWRWGLSLVGYGRGETTWVVPQATLSPSGHRVDYHRGSLDERYENTPAGLEQVFTLSAPPGQGGRDEGEEKVRGWATAPRRPAGMGPASEPNPHADPGGEEPPDSRDWMHLDLALWGDLSPRVSADGQAIDFVTPAGAPALRYAQLKVTDARGETLPAWMEGFSGENGRGIRLVVDAREAVYPITVDPMTTSAAWTAESDQASANFGSSVATAGDVNGDGYSDVIVGANLYDNGQTDEGRAYVYLGSAGGLSVSPAWTAESDQSNANFGNSVATAGDVNNDGYSDVIVGAFNFQNGQAGEGRAYLYLGSASGLATTAAWTAESDQIGAQFGWSVATAGDVNGDGYSDVIVGANLYDSDVGDEGQAYLYLGSASASGLATTPAWTASTSQSFAEFGTSVATAGDVNGDGYADVIVGAPGYSVNFLDFGAAFLYLGSASGPAASPFWTGNALLSGGAFGSSVATAGDTNGDGYADILVGDPEYSGASVSRGAVVLYRGSASDPPLQWKVLPGGNANDHFGISVSTAGDVNGDGHADILIGQVATSSLQRARIYLGSATGPTTTADWTVAGSGGFGNAVAAAGDVNGDGYSDVIVGANLYDNGESDEGRALLYLGAASGPTLTSSWTEVGDQADSAFGSSVSTAGDVNGDGYADVIVGAPYYDNGQNNEGRAFLYLGSASGLPSTPAWTAEGDQAGANFGGSVATAGDVNGDGTSDVIVGALFYDNGQADEGRSYLYLGSASGLATTAVWTAEGDQAGANFGWSLAPAGDVNGDGYSDVIIGVPGYTNGQVNEGRAYVYLGSAGGLSLSPAWTAESDQSIANFGNSVATAGDVNGDGYSDVIVGAFNFQNGETGEGRAYLYLGSASGLATTAAWTAESDQGGAQFGWSVATAGDVNGDGRSDVIVGANHYDGDGFAADDEGQAYLYLGSASASGLAASAAWTVAGDQNFAQFGSSVAMAGDVDGDGYADVIVGQPEYSTTPEPGEGRALLYLGSASGLSPAPGWTVTGNQPFAQFGSSVAMAGDVNGDGFADAIIGAWNYPNGEETTGSAFVYYGNGGDGLNRIPRQARADGTAPIGLLGKSDSETSIRLWERGLTPAGRSAIRLEYEFKPLGTPFDGTALVSSAVEDTGTPGGSGSAVTFDEAVTGLGEGTFYHWRSRIVGTDPFFPRSPWMSLAGNSVTETKLRTAGCVDRDGDGFGELSDPSCLSLVLDCNDASAAAWDTPGETVDLQFTSDTTLVWDPPAAPGAPTSALLYDTLRSVSPGDFLSASCLESDDGPNTTATDGTIPSVGQAFFYLTRAQNACPQGVGTLGTNSSGAPRAGANCP
jgi:hypothetical protein